MQGLMGEPSRGRDPVGDVAEVVHHPVHGRVIYKVGGGDLEVAHAAVTMAGAAVETDHRPQPGEPGVPLVCVGQVIGVDQVPEARPDHFGRW